MFSDLAANSEKKNIREHSRGQRQTEIVGQHRELSVLKMTYINFPNDLLKL